MAQKAAAEAQNRVQDLLQQLDELRSDQEARIDALNQHLENVRSQQTQRHDALRRDHEEAIKKRDQALREAHEEVRAVKAQLASAEDARARAELEMTKAPPHIDLDRDKSSGLVIRYKRSHAGLADAERQHATWRIVEMH
ncbi:MAG: hypothetical protein MHM6MM_007820 [Cercozoa sp. M6MM]